MTICGLLLSNLFLKFSFKIDRGQSPVVTKVCMTLKFYTKIVYKVDFSKNIHIIYRLRLVCIGKSSSPQAIIKSLAQFFLIQIS